MEAPVDEVRGGGTGGVGFQGASADRLIGFQLLRICDKCLGVRGGHVARRWQRVRGARRAAARWCGGTAADASGGGNPHR